jgi:hypothetical protein
LFVSALLNLLYKLQFEVILIFYQIFRFFEVRLEGWNFTTVISIYLIILSIRIGTTKLKSIGTICTVTSNQFCLRPSSASNQENLS